MDLMLRKQSPGKLRDLMQVHTGNKAGQELACELCSCAMLKYSSNPTPCSILQLDKKTPSVHGRGSHLLNERWIKVSVFKYVTEDES